MQNRNYHNCSFSPPNDWMKMPENGNNLLYPVPPQQRLQHTYTTSPLFYKNNKRKIRPQRQKSFPFNGFPGASANMRPCSPCGWGVHSNNAPEPFRHCDRNEIIRMPHCNVSRFNCPHPHSECDKYRDLTIYKEQEYSRNYVKMEPEERHLEWNNFANEDVSNGPTYISNNLMLNETVCDLELQNDKFLLSPCDDNISYKQCPGENNTIIVSPEETCTTNIFSNRIGSDQIDIFNDFSTTERVPERTELSHFKIDDTENQKASTLPSELEKSYETMDENALAVYFSNELYSSSPQAVNQILELSSTNPKNEVNGNFDGITEQINCLNAKESNYGQRPLSERFYECENKEQTVSESWKSTEPKLNNKFPKQNVKFNKPIIEQNRNCNDDLDLCSTKFLNGVNDDKLNSGQLSCVNKFMTLRQIGLTEEFKFNDRRCDQNSYLPLSKSCMHNASDNNDFSIPMDITSKLPQLPSRKSQTVETLIGPNANSSRSEKWKKHRSKQTPKPTNSISNTENLSLELNSKSDGNFLSTQNFITQSTPNNAGVPLNVTNTEVKESEFLYSNILDLVSPVETSLSSVTNYLLEEPSDPIGNRVTFTLDHYDDSTASQATSENAKCSRKKQKAVKRSKRSNIIQISLPTPQKLHYKQEVIKSSITLLDNAFESDIDEYLDFDLRRSRKGKIKGKKEERKSNNKSHEKLPSPATQMSSPEKLKYEAEDFKSDKLNRDSRKCFNNAVTQTSPTGIANNRDVLKRDVQTQWNISDGVFDAPENLKEGQKDFQTQYQLCSSKNSHNENNARNRDQTVLESNYDSSNFRKRSLKKSINNVSKAFVNSDNDISTNKNSETSKNISTTTFKKSNGKEDQELSLDVKNIDNVKTSSEIKNLLKEKTNSHTADEPAGGGRNRLRKGNRNLNENIKNEQSENEGKPNENKFRKKASKQMDKQSGSGNDTQDEIKEGIKCRGISSNKVSAPVRLDNQKKKQMNEEQKPNLRVRKEGSSFKKSLKSPDTEPIAHRLRQRNKGKT